MGKKRFGKSQQVKHYSSGAGKDLVNRYLTEIQYIFLVKYKLLIYT